MQPLAILITSASVSTYLRRFLESASVFETATELTAFMAGNTNATVMLHYDSFHEEIPDIITSVSRDFSTSTITVISDHPSFEQGFELLKWGIKGYANSYMSNQHYIQMLAMLTEGQVWLYPEFMQQLIHHTLAPKANIPNASVMDRLTPREHEIVSLVCDNRSNLQIAEQTGITVRTVKQHLTNIYEKLGIKDRLSLVLLMK